MSQKKTHLGILAAAAILYVVVFSWLGTVKLQRLRYTAIDFAIFHQTVAETARGNLFGSTIHPPSYLADHTSPILLPLAAIYRVVPSPLTLIVALQVVLALGVFPIWGIARRRLPKAWALGTALGYLAVPFVHTLSLFEFHAIAFAVTPLLWAWLAYERKQWGWFWAATALAVSVREDVGLVVAMLGAIALVERRSWRWVLSPIVAGLTATALGIVLPRLLGAGEGYAYGVYYAWLGERVLSPIGHLLRLLGLQHLGFALAALLPFAGLPVLAPGVLLLGLPVYAQLTLGAAGIGPLVLQLQYVALMLPALTIATVLGLERLLRAAATPQHAVARWISRSPGLLPLMLLAALGFGAITLGPITGSVALALSRPEPRLAADYDVLSSVPARVPVVAGYHYLSAVSGRPQVQALNYQLLGARQFNAGRYPVPQDNAWWVWDASDVLAFEIQYRDNPRYAQQYDQGPTRLRTLLRANRTGVHVAQDGRLVLGPSGDSLDTLWRVLADTPQAVATQRNGELELISWQREDLDDALALQLHWRLTAATTQRYHLQLSVWRADTLQSSRVYPLAYGLYPTTDWQPNTVVVTPVLLTPQIGRPPGDYRLTLEVVTLRQGHLEISSDASTQPVATFSPVGPALDLGPFTVLQRRK